MVAALLLFAFAVSVQSASFTYKYTTNWFDEANWNNETLPSANSVVMFPPSFSTFGLQSCTLNAANQCQQGGLVSIRAPVPTEQPVAQIQISKLVLPLNGKMVFETDTTMTFFEATAVSNATWADRGPHQFDFNCAANWVVTGTDQNPSFQIPCFNDTAVFPAGATYMTYVPANTFLTALNPSGSPSFSDPYEFSGATVSFLSNACPEPFAALTGNSFCQDICVNSCPSLNPDSLAGVQQIIAQDTTLNNYVTMALAAAATSTSTVSISGQQFFNVPTTATTTDIEIVRQNIITQLPNNFFLHLTVSCIPGANPISCTFTATVPNAMASIAAFSSNSFAPYSFTSGLLSTLFADTVAQWFQVQISTSMKTIAQSHQSSAFFTVSVQVPSAFVQSLPTGTAGMTLFAAALSTSFPTLPTTNVFDMTILPSPTAGAMILTFSVVPVDGVTAASVTSVLTNVVNPFVVTLQDQSLDPVYALGRDTVTPSLVTLTVVQVKLTNTAVFAALPFSSANATLFFHAIQTYVESQAPGNGAQVLATNAIPLSGFRRTTGPVFLYITTLQSSSLLNALNNTFFDGFHYGGASTDQTDLIAITLSAQEAALLSSQISLLSSQASTAAAAVTSNLFNLLHYGASAGLLATGSYSWSAVDIVPPQGSTAPGLTNGQCAMFLAANVTQAALLQQVTTQIANFLPIPASAVTLTPSSLKCAPVYPLQTQADQKAAFTVSLTVKAMYTLFGSNAAYVTYASSGINHANQPLELTAPLNTQSVLSALSAALRIVVLQNIQITLNNQTAANAALLPPAPSTSPSSGSFPIVAIAAAAGGAIVVILIIIIVVTRQRRNRPSRLSEQQRNVVAFENPMYDNAKNQAGTKIFENTSADQGLYDEPAFNTKAERANPIFDEVGHGDDFNQVIDVLAAQSDENAYNEPAGFSMSPLVDPEDIGGEDAHGYLAVAPSDEVDNIQNHGYEDQPVYDNGDGVLETKPVASSNNTGYEQQEIYDNAQYDDPPQQEQQQQSYPSYGQEIYDNETPQAFTSYDQTPQAFTSYDQTPQVFTSYDQTPQHGSYGFNGSQQQTPIVAEDQEYYQEVDEPAPAQSQPIVSVDDQEYYQEVDPPMPQSQEIMYQDVDPVDQGGFSFSTDTHDYDLAAHENQGGNGGNSGFDDGGYLYEE